MLSALRISAYPDKNDAGPDAALVMLHGLGSSPENFRAVVNQLELPGAARVELVLPRAPTLPVTVNAGNTMPAWYDVLSLDKSGGEDAAGIRRACAEVDEIVAELYARGVSHRRIAIGGFSQGGALALYSAARSPRPLAGVVALSAYMPLMEGLARTVTDAGRKTPVFMSHGIYDDVIPLDFGLLSRRALEQAGFEVAWHEHPLGHGLDARVFAETSRWLAPRLAPDQSSLR